MRDCQFAVSPVNYSDSDSDSDKAANNVVVVCRLHSINTLKQEHSGTRAYQETSTEELEVNGHTQISFWPLGK